MERRPASAFSGSPFIYVCSEVFALLSGADQLNGLFARHMLYGHLQHTKWLPVSFNGLFPVVRAIIGRILFCQLFDGGQLLLSSSRIRTEPKIKTPGSFPSMA